VAFLTQELETSIAGSILRDHTVGAIENIRPVSLKLVISVIEIL